jgi:paraquat-inducible protein B
LTEELPSLSPLVERGLRGQLRSANLLTGQLFVALDFFPGTRAASMDMAKTPPEIPTVPGSSQELQTTVTSIAKKLERIPFEEIGTDLRRTLQTASTVLNRVDKEIVPAARDTMVDAQQAMIDARKAIASVERTLNQALPLPLEATEAMREIGRAAQSFRVLADYLERHPEALIRGKKEDLR